MAHTHGLRVGTFREAEEAELQDAEEAEPRRWTRMIWDEEDEDLRLRRRRRRRKGVIRMSGSGSD